MSFSPAEVILEKDKAYFWCTCGLSSKQPFCDGAHKGSGMKSLSFTSQEETTAYLCNCKLTKNPPYCDGSHKN